MAEAKEAWSEVGAKFGGLGEKLKEHFSHPPRAAGEAGGADAGAAEGESAAAGAEAGGATDAGAADALKDALRNLADALNVTVEAIGAAAKDPAITEDVRGVGQALVNALSTTFTDAGEEVRRAFNRSRSTGEGGEGGDAASESAPGGGTDGTDRNPPADTA